MAAWLECHAANAVRALGAAVVAYVRTGSVSADVRKHLEKVRISVEHIEFAADIEQRDRMSHAAAIEDVFRNAEAVIGSPPIVTAPEDDPEGHCPDDPERQ